jgi:hypothetical protein
MKLLSVVAGLVLCSYTTEAARLLAAQTLSGPSSINVQPYVQQNVQSNGQQQKNQPQV